MELVHQLRRHRPVLLAQIDQHQNDFGIAFKVMAFPGGSFEVLDPHGRIAFSRRYVVGADQGKLVIDPTHDSVVLLGEAGPNALGEHATLTGTFFLVDAASIELIAKGERLTLTLPLRLRADPPPGARLVYQSRGFDLSTTRPAPLTPPVKADTGLSWGTLGLAIAGALFAGSFLGGLFGSRRRPPPRPSIYRTVQRRREEERAAR